MLNFKVIKGVQLQNVIGTENNEQIKVINSWETSPKEGYFLVNKDEKYADYILIRALKNPYLGELTITYVDDDSSKTMKKDQ